VGDLAVHYASGLAPSTAPRATGEHVESNLARLSGQHGLYANQQVIRLIESKHGKDIITFKEGSLPTPLSRLGEGLIGDPDGFECNAHP